MSNHINMHLFQTRLIWTALGFSPDMSHSKDSGLTGLGPIHIVEVGRGFSPDISGLMPGLT